MCLGLMDMLQTDLNRLCHVGIELELFGESHHCPCLSNSTNCTVQEVLVGPTMDPNKYTIAPADPFASDSPFMGSAFESQSLADKNVASVCGLIL